MTDRFYTTKTCDRCKKQIGMVRTMSWFTEDCICSTCHKEETNLKTELNKRGINTSALEGCGYVPKIKEL